MSVTVCQTPAALFCVDTPTDTWFTPTKNTPVHDVWTVIQSKKSPCTAVRDSSPTYVHPLVRRPSMSNSSLEMCTESLGSETGSDDFTDDDHGLLNYSSDKYEIVENQKTRQSERALEEGNQRTSVNYHHSASRQSVTRSFPPPLASLSRHDGTCIQMRTCRQGGHLVVEAIPVASENYLHARRLDGRLLLSFVHSPSGQNLANDCFPAQIAGEPKDAEPYKGEADYEEDKEEVEVVDRGSMVEVKVSMHLQQGGSAKKVLRSSLVINKFVGGAPLTNENRLAEPADDDFHNIDVSESQQSLPRQPRLVYTTTTAAAAAVAASSGSASPELTGQHPISVDDKQLFMSKPQNREEILNQMRRCSELRRPLFFWEAGCVASSGGCISC